MNEFDHSLPSDFENRVRLFPLPDLVLFPGVVQALHIFEPRYRAMMEDALAGDRMLTLIRLEPPTATPDWGEKAIAATGCLGKIVSEVRLEDGRFNLFLVGLKRVRVLSEPLVDRPYRVADVEVVDESHDHPGLEPLREELIQKFQALVQQRANLELENMLPVQDPALPFPQMLDLMAFASGAESSRQQQVLDAYDLGQRAELVMRLLDEGLKMDQPTNIQVREFPPGFSLN